MVCKRDLISLIYTTAKTNESAHVPLRYESTFEKTKSESPLLTLSFTDIKCYEMWLGRGPGTSSEMRLIASAH